MIYWLLHLIAIKNVCMPQNLAINDLIVIYSHTSLYIKKKCSLSLSKSYLNFSHLSSTVSLWSSFSCLVGFKLIASVGCLLFMYNYYSVMSLNPFKWPFMNCIHWNCLWCLSKMKFFKKKRLSPITINQYRILHFV